MQEELVKTWTAVEQGNNALFYEKNRYLDEINDEARRTVDSAKAKAAALLGKAEKDAEVMLALYAEYLVSKDSTERAGYLAAIRSILQDR